ncbi:MAG TPA: AMP-binding protein [Hyphomicrobiaceae bacterium]|jgi:crotonobetaine/carnitine-CoA ligase|nr:AMP-binding protein [Hyphomicrobiaceae bacterium]
MGDETIGAVFLSAAASHADRPFLVVPANPSRSYLPSGMEITYAEAGRRVEALSAAYRAAGYGLGHRVATLMENHPDYIVHKLALNAIGACCVPINPDYRMGETAYLIEHSEPHLILTLESRETGVGEALAQCSRRPPIAVSEAFASSLRPAVRKATEGRPTTETPASILYTSGTTGRPKGCILSHGYEVAAGARYTSLGGLASLRPGRERIYNPLPLYHVNSGVVSLLGAILTGCCQIQPERFHPQRWWPEVVATRATIVHYLGIVAAMLHSQPPTEDERSHCVRFGLGAGIEPQLHRAVEQRFGFPFIEIWGMTEMVRILADSSEPRQVGTRAFGRAIPGVEVRVVDDEDNDVADTAQGEMLFRHSAETPRRHCFSGYLKDEAATEAAWRGGWFHTGDVVWRGPDGMLHFVDRKKNIIRRSGENIAAAEVEAVLLTHPDVAQAAVMAVKDEVREEEVLACIVLKREKPAADAAKSIFRFCLDHLAYYKAPGWIHIVQSLPTTGTQKIQKHTVYPQGVDPRSVAGVMDFRPLKRRGRD